MSERQRSRPLPRLPFLENSAEPAEAGAPAPRAREQVATRSAGGAPPRMVFSRPAQGPAAAGGAAQEEAAPPAPAPAVRPQARRRQLLRLSAALVIALPTLLACLYYGLWASDQYSVELRFAVRGPNTTGGGDILGIFAGLPAASTTTADSYISIDYILSREMVAKLESRIKLRSMYSRSEIDWFARFNPTYSAEEFLKYWRKMVGTSFDTSSQIIALEVRAFTAADARLIATTILEVTEELINDLSARARSDSVRHAEQEVKRAEDRLKANRTAMMAFRDTQKEFNPVKQAESRYTILGRLEEELSKAKTQLGGMRAFLGENAPSVVVKKSEISSLERQLEEERGKLGKSDAGGAPHSSLGGLVASFEELSVERDFAEKAYHSALASLERARVDADRQQRYISAFVRPSLPEEAMYPKRLQAVGTVLALSAILWSIMVLVVYAVRDHGF